MWKDIFQHNGQRAASSQKKKEKKKKGSTKSSESSGSPGSSSSNSSKPEKPTAAKQRILDAHLRKEQLVEAKIAKQIQKVEEAARAKSEAAAAKVASDEAKQKQKEKLATQATYTRLFNDHAQLVAELMVVPFSQQTDESFIAANVTAAAGEELMTECLEAMKNKTAINTEEVKTMMVSIKKAVAEVKKLSAKRRKIN